MSAALNVLVTGCQGFVGATLCQRLSQIPEIGLTGISRRPATLANAQHLCVELTTETDLSATLQQIDVVVHTAARVHQMQDSAADPLQAFRLVNRDVTLQLARAAAAAGVKRFVFLSSIKAMGEQHPAGQPFEVSDQTNPADPYGVSKWEAEQGLRALAKETAMEVVIIRPPLVYGPGVKANFQLLIGLVARQLPLPFGRVDNRRSLVGLDNLVDLLLVCLQHPAAANQTFLVSDNADLSTPALLRVIADALNMRCRLLPLPVGLLRFAGQITGRQAQIERLCGTLQLDIRHTCETLNWHPPVSVQQGIAKTVQAYLAAKGAA